MRGNFPVIGYSMIQVCSLAQLAKAELRGGGGGAAPPLKKCLKDNFSANYSIGLRPYRGIFCSKIPGKCVFGILIFKSVPPPFQRFLDPPPESQAYVAGGKLHRA